MARLRIRMELSGGGAGVPLHKLSSVIAESQKFLNLLTGDVQIDQQRGEWLGFDFDRESLNFTAEYVGPVTAEQLAAFNAAFDGTTSLRRDTITQFLRITEAIGDDEVMGFGLYQADDATEPAEWRCLSRRDAWRIAEEVQILMGAGQAPHLPAAGDPSLGARMFGERHNRNFRESRLAEYVREVESGLSARLQHVETELQKHSGIVQDLQMQSAATESSFRNLLSTFETFCDQATRSIERMSPPASLAAPSAGPEAPSLAAAAASPPATAGSPSAAAFVPDVPDMTRAKPPAFAPRTVWIAAAGVAVALAFVAAVWLWPAHEGATGGKQVRSSATTYTPSTEPATVAAAGVETPARRPAAPVAGAASPAPPAGPGAAMEIDLDATEPSWVSMKDQNGKLLFAQLIVPGSGKTVKLEGSGTLRAGNAGGLAVRLNGHPIGPLGPHGGVRDVVFEDGKFTIVAP